MTARGPSAHLISDEDGRDRPRAPFRLAGRRAGPAPLLGNKGRGPADMEPHSACHRGVWKLRIQVHQPIPQARSRGPRAPVTGLRPPPRPPHATALCLPGLQPRRGGKVPHAHPPPLEPRSSGSSPDARSVLGQSRTRQGRQADGAERGAAPGATRVGRATTEKGQCGKCGEACRRVNSVTCHTEFSEFSAQSHQH